MVMGGAVYLLLLPHPQPRALDMQGSLQSHLCARLLLQPWVPVGWDWTLTSQELPWQTPLTALPGSHVDIGSLQCQEADLQPQARRRGCNTAGCTQRDREAHIIQRPHWWARIAILWESGRGIPEDSLEEVRFKGLYLESSGEQTVCTFWMLGILDVDQGWCGRSCLELRLGHRWEGLVEASVH